MASKVAMVTGAGSGIGRATAAAFAAAGYAVMLVDFDADGGAATESAIRADGGECRFVRCDVADGAAVQRVVGQAVAEFGRLDAAFNAAGISGEAGRLTAECSPENWNAVIGVNLSGVWNCLRHQIPAMLESGGGAIVNCASSAGIRGAAYCAAYSASKHGVVGLTRSAALEYGSRGVRINAVCPGMIDTPMTQDPAMQDVIAMLVEQSPLQRIGQPQEVAAAVLWLCGDSATFVHGQAIPVDGALTTR
jgi:NAD(P)-dependent dehydrogenase (short-subunit alcohol dehydrogenase family)